MARPKPIDRTNPPVQIGTAVRARTAQQLARQERVFELSVLEGKTYREIMAELGIASDTLVDDMRYEEARRADELAARRETALARSVAFYDTVKKKALNRADNPLMPGDSGRYADALKAQERIDKLQGLDAPTRVDVGVVGLLAAITELPG